MHWPIMKTNDDVIVIVIFSLQCGKCNEYVEGEVVSALGIGSVFVARSGFQKYCVFPDMGRYVNFSTIFTIICLCASR